MFKNLLKPQDSPELEVLIALDARLVRPAPRGPLEVGKCQCGASYYREEEIGRPCEIQYCRGTINAMPQKGDKHGR